MRHRNAGKVFDRVKAPREAMLKSLVGSVVIHEKIQTTEAKAKAIKPLVEKLVTRSMDPSLANRRYLLSYFKGQELPVKKLLEVLGPRFKSRKGGYCRITKVGPRKGDGGEMAQIEFV